MVLAGANPISFIDNYAIYFSCFRVSIVFIQTPLIEEIKQFCIPALLLVYLVLDLSEVSLWPSLYSI